MTRFTARSVPGLVALTCAGMLGLTACGSTQDAATSVTSPPVDAASTTSPGPTDSPKGSESSSDAPLGKAPTAHPNVVSLDAGSGVTSIAYSFDGGYFISPGQESTWGGVTNCSPATACDITVTAGRHDDPATAAWFTDHASAYGCDAGPNCSPKGMNFAFTGTISINGADYPFTLGQFGDGWFSNYWIYGGPGWSPASGPNGATTPDGKYSVNCCSPRITVKAT